MSPIRQEPDGPAAGSTLEKAGADDTSLVVMREVRASQEQVLAVSEQLERLNRTLANLEDSHEQIVQRIDILKENTVAVAPTGPIRRDRSKNRYEDAQDTPEDMIKRSLQRIYQYLPPKEQ